LSLIEIFQDFLIVVLKMKLFTALILLLAVYSTQGKSIIQLEELDADLLISDEPQPEFTFIVSADDEQLPPLAVSPAYVAKNTHFLLWTRQHQSESKELKTGNETVLKESGYNHGKPTKIFAHGFQMNGRDGLVLQMRDEYLKREDCNFIAVDWEKLASAPNYLRAADSTSPVGELTGQLINFLVKQGSQLSQFHVIGFSLGAHVAGKTGATVDGVLPRVTGLDPAYPDYSMGNTKDRLDRSDAEFVDVIHTNSGSLFTAALSFPQAIGHADFFVNGGHSQPGCGFITSGDISDLIHACSHDRAVLYFIESINSKVGFKSLLCDTWKHFTHKKCVNDSTNEMGEPISEKTKGTFYLTTNSKSPFAHSL